MTVTSPSAANGHVPGSPYAFSTAANTAFSEEAALSLTNINDINRFLHETVAKERSIDAELEQLLTRRTEVEKSILALHTASSEVFLQHNGLLATMSAHGCCGVQFCV